MAGLDELTASIAHEIQRPLNFAGVLSELMQESGEVQAAGDTAEVAALTEDVIQNLTRIHQHGQRAASIVRGLLEHSPEQRRARPDRREGPGRRVPAPGLPRPAGQRQNLQRDPANRPGARPTPPIKAGSGDLGRVLLNLFANAFYAVQQRQRAGEPACQPAVGVATRRVGNAVEVRVHANGTGMSEAVQARIFQPFFTTKPTGEGTGLGLSLSYDIITKGHGGTLTVQSQPGQGTGLTLLLPA